MGVFYSDIQLGILEKILKDDFNILLVWFQKFGESEDLYKVKKKFQNCYGRQGKK